MLHICSIVCIIANNKYNNYNFNHSLNNNIQHHLCLKRCSVHPIEFPLRADARDEDIGRLCGMSESPHHKETKTRRTKGMFYLKFDRDNPSPRNCLRLPWVVHMILETAQSPNSPFPFWIRALDFGLGLGLGLGLVN